jgi:stage II sporulation protein D
MKGKLFIFILIALLGFIFTSSAWSMAAKPQGPKKYIRVQVGENKSHIDLLLKGNYKIMALHTNKLLAQGTNLETIVYPTYSGLRFKDEEFKIFGVRVRTEDDASIIIDGRKFRGLIDIIRDSNLTLLVVNHVDVEEYLCGVLYHEVSHLWPYEALKAQAIASRTFALYQHKENKDKDYDLTNTSFSQVYGGATSEKYRTNRAVIATYGEVLTYKDKIFPTYYHAACGGHTQDASRLWDIDLPPLKGIKCNYCKISPYYSWTKKIPLVFIQKKLNSSGLSVGKIYSIEASGYDRSGRVINLNIINSEGNTTVSAYRFRIRIGTVRLRSTKFKVEVKNDTAFFYGQGWGHGVGLCQWGAMYMALKGFNKEEILNFYYPHTEIKNIWAKDDNPE